MAGPDREPTTVHHDASKPARRHDLDALRAFAMLLGIVLHAALSFIDVPWPVQDQSRAPWFALIVSVIHGFRMPLFFLISGYFTAMLWRSRGLRGLLRQRAIRIAIPLGLGCLTIVPIMWALVIGLAGRPVDYRPVDTARDLWTAAAFGNVDAVERFIDEGADLDGPDPVFAQSPLAWAIIGDRLDVVDRLLAAGADPADTYGDDNTALHTAAFFGRVDAAERLLAAGALPDARNVDGETPADAMRHDRGATEWLAELLQFPIDFERVEAGRARIAELLPATAEPVPTEVSERSSREAWKEVIGALMSWPFYHHLWFLWFLCWLVVGFAVVAFVLDRLPPLRLPALLIATPLCLLWLVPLTMVTQSWMHGMGTRQGFGPDTSAGILPIPHVLAHYGIFFGFGALLYMVPRGADRIGRGWWITLPLALVIFPGALALSMKVLPVEWWPVDERVRHWLGVLGQVLFAWLMIFACMGLFEAWLSRERPWARYLSDSSYWLYLVHLPLLLVFQALLRDLGWPASLKLLLMLVVTSALLLASYRWFVRYTPIGTLLNGPRTRPGDRQGELPDL